MAQVTFNTPVIKIPGKTTKFDTIVVSNSFVAFIGDYIEARIVQQLHYWSYSEYGVIINGLRWIYKPIREWLSESFVGFTSWQLRKAIASLVEKRILLKEHLLKEHHGNNFAPKNRTFYYSVNYARLEELAVRHAEPVSASEITALAEKRETAETTENLGFVSPTEQFCENSEKQFCNTAKNKAKSTSIKNDFKDLSHPHRPCVCETKKEISQEQEFSNPKPSETEEIDSVNSKAIEKWLYSNEAVSLMELNNG